MEDAGKGADGSGSKCFVKLVVIGDSGVGKSSLIHFFQKGQFSQHFKPTIGADFANREVQLEDDKVCVLQIWDTAGQERFQSLSSAFYRGADCCCMVYDITSPQSFEHLANWKSHFLSRSQSENPEQTPFLVLGNKVDLEEEGKRKVKTATVEKWCKETGDMIFYETSAKNNINVVQGFTELAALAVKKQEEIAQTQGSKGSQRGKLIFGGSKSGNQSHQGLKLSQGQKKEKKKRGRCCGGGGGGGSKDDEDDDF